MLKSLIDDPSLAQEGAQRITWYREQMKVLQMFKTRYEVERPFEGKTLLVILVDATWACAKKMVKLSKNLHTLQKISFTAGYKSIYTFKTEPQEDFISTIETCYYLLKELRDGQFSTTLTQADFSPEPLMNIFKKMIHTQLESQRLREESGEPDRYQLAGSIRAKKRALREQQGQN